MNVTHYTHLSISLLHRCIPQDPSQHHPCPRHVTQIRRIHSTLPLQRHPPRPRNLQNTIRLQHLLQRPHLVLLAHHLQRQCRLRHITYEPVENMGNVHNLPTRGRGAGHLYQHQFSGHMWHLVQLRHRRHIYHFQQLFGEIGHGASIPGYHHCNPRHPFLFRVTHRQRLYIVPTTRDDPRHLI